MKLDIMNFQVLPSNLVHLSNFTGSMVNIPVINQQLQTTAFPSSDKAILVYASAHWCGPCRAFTPLLKGFYESAKASGALLEVIFLSSDRSEREMISYYKESHGSWLAVPFFAPERQFLGSHFNVRGIPSLILLNRGTMQAVDIDVRSLVQQAAMAGTSDRMRAIVNELRERSGATLFGSIPRSMCSLTSQQQAVVFELLSKLVTNIAEHPTEGKYKQIKADNPTIRKSILDLSCGDAPLRALGFQSDGSGSYVYRTSFPDPVTTKLILQNRESNGLSVLAVSAPVGSSSSATRNAIPSQGVASPKEVKFRVLFRNMNPQTTDGIPISEPVDVIKAISESICDVPGELQQIFCPAAKKEGALTASDKDLSARFDIASTSSSTLDLLVIGQHTSTNPIALAETDEEAHRQAQRLRSSLSAMGNPTINSLLTDAIHMQLYEVPSNQYRALSLIPVMELHAAANARLKQAIPIAGSTKPSSYEECLFVELLNWFKTKFFTWTDKPMCSQCGATSTTLVNGSGQPTPEEVKGLASRTEVYACTVCGSSTRFPRFNHPVALLSTRTGRCGEWSNCFALVARAMGFEVRRVFDSADHVWNEVWMEHRREWVHADPCENAYDQPMIYAVGWGKKPSFTVGISKDGVADVSRRYCPKQDLLAAPRIDQKSISSLNELLMSHWSVLSGGDNRLSALRERNEEEEMSLADLIQTDRSNQTLGGRTTGSLEWRTARGEMGTSSFKTANGVDVFLSNTFGGSHADTRLFSDQSVLETLPTEAIRLSKVKLWDDGKLVTGIECEWDNAGAVVHGASHLSSGASKDPSVTLILAQGERVSAIRVRTGSLVDSIQIDTSFGQQVSVGNPKGGEENIFTDLRADRELIGFHGGLGGHIHNVGVLTRERKQGPVSPSDVELMKQVYKQLVEKGMDRNDAAIEALNRVRQ